MRAQAKEPSVMTKLLIKLYISNTALVLLGEKSNPGKEFKQAVTN